MATHPQGKGTVNISLNLPNEMVDEINERANAAGLSRNNYCMRVLRNFMDQDYTFNLQPIRVAADPVQKKYGNKISKLQREPRKPA
jgi:metal-responsive CopG/Arc/MetJ family transcriptional regulator